MEVHRQLGCGFLEEVYQEAFEIELAVREIPFRAQVKLPVTYKGRLLKAFYKPDVIGYDAVIVELKAISQLSTVEDAQLLNYMKATGLELGLLINFGRLSLEYKRLVLSKSSPNS